MSNISDTVVIEENELWSVNKCGKCHEECVTRCHYMSLICHNDAWCQDGEVKPCITDHSQPVNNHINPGRKRGAIVFKDSLGIKMKTLNY